MNISAAEFKAKCLKLMDEVKEHHTQITITKYGKPVAKLVPVDEGRVPILGAMAGTIEIHGDIIGPAGEIWDAEKDVLRRRHLFLHPKCVRKEVENVLGCLRRCCRRRHILLHPIFGENGEDGLGCEKKFVLFR